MSLAMHAKKRIEIFVEAPALQQVTEALDRAAVQGYTVVEATAGRGHTGSWRLDDSFNNATNVLVVVCILDAAKVDDVVSSVFEIVRRQIGVLTVSDVMVVRPEHF
jgi:nitrogen regulatory protein PII